MISSHDSAATERPDRTFDGKRYFEPEFETMSKEALDALQWTEFRRQLETAQRSSFYRAKFARTNFDPGDIRGRRDLPRIPVTRKDEVCADLERNPPYGSRLAVGPDQIVSIVETSGTSGKGKEVHVRTAADVDQIVRAEAIGFTWAGMTHGTVVGFTIPIAMSAAGLLWFVTLDRLRANCLRLGHFATEEKLRYMVRYGVESIVAMPTYLARMEVAANEMGIDIKRELPDLRTILVAGEAKSPRWAAERERVWGATIYEQWGCTQGAVAFACEAGMAPNGQSGMLHSIPHLALSEVVDPETGRPVADGEFGEIVITPLGIEGAPLIRFATGDRARFRAAESCVCGRPFDGIEASSVSRYDDMIKVKGVNLWPSAISAVVDKDSRFAEHRLTAALDERGRETLTVELEFAAQTPEEERDSAVDELRSDLQSSLGIRVDVVEWTGSRSLASEVLGEGVMKAKRWRDLRAPEGRGF